MWLLLLPLKMRYLLVSVALGGLALSVSLAWRHQDQGPLLAVAIGFFGFFSAARAARLFSSAACNSAQLPHHRPPALPVREDPAGDAAVLLRGRQGRHAVPARQARARLSARKRRSRQAPVRHHLRRLPVALRVASPFRRAQGARTRASAITIGGPDCTQPYSASVFNISAMSYGSLSANAVRALNKGAKMGGFAHDTGEGGFSPYHRENGGDIIWELGSGYFGCRNRDGTFAPEKFAEVAANPQIKMVELKLSQGAKPGHGGVLPGAKVTREISRIRGVPQGEDCISPGQPLGVLDADRVDTIHCRDAAPVGWKAGRLQAVHRPSLGVPGAGQGHAWRQASLPTSSSSTAPRAAPARRRSSSWITSACRCAMASRSCIQRSSEPICATASRSAPPARSSPASTWRASWRSGADWCNAARGFMFAVGCIQAQQCHTGRCPTGVTSQDRSRQRAVVVSDKSVRVANFHRETVKALAELVGAAGLDHPSQLRPHHFMRRVAADRVVTFAQLYPCLKPGELLSDTRRRASSRRLGDGAVGQFRSGNHGRIARDLPSSRVELHCPDRVVTPIAGACASRRTSSGAAPRRCRACRGGARSRRRWGSSSAKPP